jgi:hypothetical protein
MRWCATKSERRRAGATISTTVSYVMTDGASTVPKSSPPTAYWAGGFQKEFQSYHPCHAPLILVLAKHSHYLHTHPVILSCPHNFNVEEYKLNIAALPQ